MRWRWIPKRLEINSGRKAGKGAVGAATCTPSHPRPRRLPGPAPITSRDLRSEQVSSPASARAERASVTRTECWLSCGGNAVVANSAGTALVGLFAERFRRRKLWRGVSACGVVVTRGRGEGVPSGSPGHYLVPPDRPCACSSSCASDPELVMMKRKPVGTGRARSGARHAGTHSEPPRLERAVRSSGSYAASAQPRRGRPAELQTERVPIGSRSTRTRPSGAPSARWLSRNVRLARALRMCCGVATLPLYRA